MTEPLDLEALKPRFEADEMTPLEEFRFTKALIEELEVTRAERDGNYNEMMTAYGIAEANLKRAVQAEAERKAADHIALELQRRLTEAEAAIARVEAWAHRCTEHYFDDMAADIRAALRGDE